MASGLIAFRKSKTTVNPLTPENASSLVIAGIYRVTRNPMYLGMLLILSAWGLFLGKAITFLVLPVFVTFMNKLQIIPEEEALERLFSQVFLDYLSSYKALDLTSSCPFSSFERASSLPGGTDPG